MSEMFNLLTYTAAVKKIKQIITNDLTGNLTGKAAGAEVVKAIINGTGIGEASISPSALKGKYIENPASYNLYNKANAQNFKLIHNTPANGLATTAADAIFSGIVPVESGKTYLITQPLRAIGAIFAFGVDVAAPLFNTGSICAETAAGGKYGNWTLDKTKFARTNGTSPMGYYQSVVAIIDPNIKYIGWHMHSDSYWTGHTTEQFNSLINETQVVESNEEKPYQPYEIYRLAESALPTSVSDYILNANQFKTIRKDIVVVKDGIDIVVRTRWDDANDIYTLWNYPRTGYNEGLNMVGIYTIDKNATYGSQGGTLFKNCVDDCTPLCLNGSYVGGNHGFNFSNSITATSHGKTTPDIGSLWAIGGVNYILADIVDANTLIVISDYTGDQTAPAVLLANSSGTLAHVSGAANTADINYTASIATQIRPATNHKSVALSLDGREIALDGTYEGDKFDIIEKYTIIDIPSFQAFLKTCIGGTEKPKYDDDSIDGWVEVVNTYSHNKNGSVTVKTSYYFLKETDISFYGVVQSMPIGDKVYVPGMGISAGLDLSTVVTQSTANIGFEKTLWLDANEPPYRYHQFNVDMSKGMAIGYNQSYGMAKISVRKESSDAGSIYGETHKMYPNVKVGGAAVAGDFHEIVAFRCPMKVIDSDATCLYWYWVGDDIYLAFDYHKNIDKVISLPPYMAGMKIEQLDVHPNTTVQSEFVSAQGIKIKVINSYGYGALRLYK